MTTSDLEFIEIDKHGFKVLVKPFQAMPFKIMMPIVELSIKNPESPELFKMLVEVFTTILPVDKIDEFETCTMQEAIEIIGEWMNKND